MTKSKDDKISVAVTGLGWMKKGVRSIWSVVEDIVLNASDEIQIAVYLITSGASDFLQLLRRSLQRGTKISLIVNSFASQPSDIQETLLEFANTYSNFTLLDFHGSERDALHAKLVVADRKVAFIGSSNLTWGGLTLNHEMGVRIEGSAAGKVAGLIDCLGGDQKTSRVVSKVA